MKIQKVYVEKKYQIMKNKNLFKAKMSQISNWIEICKNKKKKNLKVNRNVQLVLKVFES